MAAVLYDRIWPTPCEMYPDGLLSGPAPRDFERELCLEEWLDPPGGRRLETAPRGLRTTTVTSRPVAGRAEP